MGAGDGEGVRAKVGAGAGVWAEIGDRSCDYSLSAEQSSGSTPVAGTSRTISFFLTPVHGFPTPEWLLSSGVVFVACRGRGGGRDGS